MSNPDNHKPEVDPVTGYETTGHDWNGIQELNTPFPKLVIWALILTFVYSVITWVLLPAWPTGRDFTRGVLGLDQGDMAVAGLQHIDTQRNAWLAPFGADDFAALGDDVALMARAMPAADRLFRDNCAACHGDNGGGGHGFPALNDEYWLWGNDPEAIAETLHLGINANDDARWAQMPAFDWMERSEQAALADFVSGLADGPFDESAPAATLFAENCSSCHGEAGEGGLLNGAPSLSDAAVIYGQDRDTVLQTLRHGRQGVMPTWSNRLSDAEINLLALYVSRLAHKEPEVTE
jgi:cytochrome c oxidase cbb3-type subunit 3